uniref:Uncharacterized protein n=1 Tax=Siphoviridae sp. ctAnS47 TaxID=2826183 RepID=A0A8S5QXR8_9CAUD|nr:MAG TPA: hypothetical protein [Siphoviridae sp. ctAnS47]
MTGSRGFVLSVRSVPEEKYIKQYVLSVTYSYSSPFHHFHFIHLMCMGLRQSDYLYLTTGQM